MLGIKKESIEVYLDLIKIFHQLIKFISTLATSQQSFPAHTSAPANSGHADLKPGFNRPRASLYQFLQFSLFRFELWVGRIGDHLPLDRDSSGSSPISKHQNRGYGFNNWSFTTSQMFQLDRAYLPPLDVCWVWYCYCLRSRAYFEDSIRSYPILHSLDFPTELIVSQYSHLIHHDIRGGELEILEKMFVPRSVGVDAQHRGSAPQLWLELTNTDFDPIQFYFSPTMRTVLCPQCDGCIEKEFLTRVSTSQDGGKVVEIGWSEDKPETSAQNPLKSTFVSSASLPSSLQCQLNCSTCNWQGTKADLSLHKLLRDVRSGLTTIPSVKTFVPSGGAKAKNKEGGRSEFLKYLSNSSSIPVDPTTLNCLCGTLTTEDSLVDQITALTFNQIFLSNLHYYPKLYKSILFSASSSSTATINMNVNDNHHLLIHSSPASCSSSTSTRNRFPPILKLLSKVSESHFFKNSIHDYPEPFGTPKDPEIVQNSWKRLLIGYSVPEPFSTDLIRSMRSEIGFIEKIVALGWTLESANCKDPGPERGNVAYSLDSCIARYHAFVDLVPTMPKNYIAIPTLDIDLAWRADRLRGIKYVEYMFEWNRRLIDHPCELDLDRALVKRHFNLTSMKWIEKYQIGYTRYRVPYVRLPPRVVWLKEALKRSMVTEKPTVRFVIHPDGTREDKENSAETNTPAIEAQVAKAISPNNMRPRVSSGPVRFHTTSPATDISSPHVQFEVKSCVNIGKDPDTQQNSSRLGHEYGIGPEAEAEEDDISENASAFEIMSAKVEKAGKVDHRPRQKPLQLFVNKSISSSNSAKEGPTQKRVPESGIFSKHDEVRPHGPVKYLIAQEDSRARQRSAGIASLARPSSAHPPSSTGRLHHPILKKPQAIVDSKNHRLHVQSIIEVMKHDQADGCAAGVKREAKRSELELDVEEEGLGGVEEDLESEQVIEIPIGRIGFVEGGRQLRLM